jgi:thioredoxin-like negative regulator of GroEL
VSRIDTLKGFIAQRPDDPFPRYALALEYKNAGRLEEARETFAALMAAHPRYTPAYLHAGNTLVALGRTDEARAVYRAGIEACGPAGDAHARGELEGALATLPAGG